MTIMTTRRTIGFLLVGVLTISFLYLAIGNLSRTSTKPKDLTASFPPVTGQETVKPEAKPLVPEASPPQPERDFFIEYRLQRDRLRSQHLQLLKEIINNPNSSNESRQDAQNQLLELSRLAEQELEVENLIKAKGYPEAVVFIEPNSATVVVGSKNWQGEDANRIADIVARATSLTLEDIVIIPKTL
ncbi:MAG: SpoIIIAH-like family protein [Clostridia bacterium]|nr:SpoIIIAH-like family protein [Clostridia bacterium]